MKEIFIIAITIVTSYSFGRWMGNSYAGATLMGVMAYVSILFED